MNNRIIKFRAWDGQDKKMVHFTLEDLLDLQGKMETNYLGVVDYANNRMYETVMQFTGLLDKNGKEIYEGDILKCERDYWETPRNLVVEWNEDCWSLLKTDDPVDSEVLNHNSSFNVPEYQREVIGNIYSNPELIASSVG